MDGHRPESGKTSRDRLKEEMKGSIRDTGKGTGVGPGQLTPSQPTVIQNKSMKIPAKNRLTGLFLALGKRPRSVLGVGAS